MSEQSALDNYISFDIETTGFNRATDRIIEIAAIEYQMGKKVAEFEMLVNPEMELPRKIVSLTKISQEEVDCAPTLSAVIPRFLEFIGDKLLLGHNICSFDIPFLECQMGMSIENRLMDTLDLVKQYFPGLPSYRLSYLKDTLQLNCNESHRALADSETTNDLLWACIHPEQYEFQYNQALLHADEFLEAKEHKRRGSEYNKVCVRDIYPTVDDINPASVLYGKNIVFTGNLSIPRTAAMQMAVNAGAFVKSAVSSKTHYLVSGWQDNALVGGDGMSEKEEKAYALNEAGKANIQIISEEEFAQLLTADRTDSPCSAFSSDKELYQALLDASSGRLEQMGIAPNLLLLKEISNSSVACFLDPSKPLCYIRVKKTGSTISFFADAGKALPTKELTLHRLENTNLIRATIAAKEDVPLCVDAFINAIKIRIQAYHTFDCCSRYESCSDAKRCLHPIPAEALGCTYGKRLREGHIYYGKNKNNV